MRHDPEGVSVASSVKDDVQPSSPPMGSVFDGVDCRRSLCTLNGRRWNSNGQYEQGALSIWDDEMNVDVDVGTGDLCDGALGNAKGRHRPSL